MTCRTAALAAAIPLALPLILSFGCGGREYEIADVEGVVLINGQAGHKLRVEFIPDLGVAGPRSVGETDTQGRFTLNLMEREGPSPGAVVGKHKVTLSDLQLAASADGRGVPIRFGPEYTMSSSTPLTQEVTTGKQTIEIKLP